MLALLLIVMGTILGVLVSSFFVEEESTWLTYYIGGIVGLLVSSVILEIRNVQKPQFSLTIR
ncbi:MAG: hypothetical protein JRJ82_14080 [Deltaproteobacteria bacterium]|nr:hypothetical protein [Deltaproteobacteria bacterium]